MIGVKDKIDINRDILKAKYAVGDEEWANVVSRVVKYVLPEDRELQDVLYDLIYHLKFLPGGRILANAGLDEGTLLNCFILPVEDSLDSIFKCVEYGGKILGLGGGVGVNWSALRENGAPVGKRGGLASGPISFIRMFDSMANTIRQGRSRRGACMAILNSDHPDIWDFIDEKAQEGNLVNHNISVLVKHNIPIQSRYDGKIIEEFDQDKLYTKIAQAAWRNGEPGVMFYDNINLSNPAIDELGPIEASNPCLHPDTLIFDRDRLRKVSEQGMTYRSWKTGVKPIYELLLSDGSRILLTEDHKVLTEKGMVPAKKALDLQIRTRYDGRFWSGDYEFDSLGFVIGILLALSPLYTSMGRIIEEEKILLFRARRNFTEAERSALDEWGCIVEGSNIKVSEGAILFDKIDKSDLMQPPNEKRIPEWIMTSDVNFVGSFLSGYMAMNAGPVHKRRFGVFGYNLEFARQLQILFRLFGIQSIVNRNLRLDFKPMEVIKAPMFGSYYLYIDTIKSMERLKELFQIKTDEFFCNGRWTGPVAIALRKLGECEVWDYSMHSDPHLNMCNGIICSNCSEILAWPWSGCDLGSMNLGRYVVNGEFDEQGFRRDVRSAVKFLDSVLDRARYPLKKIERFQREYRQIGLGIMGFHDMLIKLQIPYDSQECLELIDRVGFALKESADEASKEIGPGKIDEHRNIMRTCVAPTGSISMLAKASNGIEPYFSLVTVKKTGIKEFKIYCPMLSELDDDLDRAVKKAKELPWFKTALEIDPEWHIKVLAQWTKWIDSGISKTINLRNSATVEDVKRCIILAHRLGVKSFTIYRDGSREEQILYSAVEDKQKRPVVFNRSEVLEGRTWKKKVGCGVNMYITINEDENIPVECFLNIGKSGGCVRAFSEALGRLISIYLQDVGDIKRLTDQLNGIVCSSSALGFRSCPSLVGEIISGMKGNSNVGKGVCPECGAEMVDQEGCLHCEVCGYSRCEG